jgi:hypothetical protein
MLCQNPTLTDITITMRLLKFLPAIAVCLSPLWAVAQQAAPGPGSTPPRLETLQEGTPPDIPILKPEGGATTTEQRDNSGKVREIKVQSGNSTYYVKPNDQPGTSVPGDAESNATRPAQWKIFDFDFGGRSKANKELDAVQTLEPAPPPPPMPSSPANK